MLSKVALRFSLICKFWHFLNVQGSSLNMLDFDVLKIKQTGLNYRSIYFPVATIEKRCSNYTLYTNKVHLDTPILKKHDKNSYKKMFTILFVCSSVNLSLKSKK